MESRNTLLDANGREIVVDGVQYNKYIKHGYKVSIDGTRLLSRKMKMLESFIVPDRLDFHEKVEKPKGKAKTEKIISAKNPEMIETDNVTFKLISKEYYYDPENNASCSIYNYKAIWKS